MTEPNWITQFYAGYAPFGVESHKQTRRTIYCISEGVGMPVKIGMTTDIVNRHMGLQAATWRVVYLCWAVPGFAHHEAALKSIFRDIRSHGEWFHDKDDATKLALSMDSTTDDLERLINDLAAQFGTPTKRPRESRLPPTPLHTFPRGAA